MKPRAKPKPKPKPKPKAKGKSRAGKPAVLLSGGNPQIAMAYGDAPVQAYIAAMPGWKSDLGKRLDRLIARNVPNVRKAVKWNSPLYGIEGQGWFLGLHVFARYLKVAFFRGSSLRPLPPEPSKDKNTRYLHIHEGDELDEARWATWLEQAAALPGWFDRKSERPEASVSRLIDERIRDLGGWRGETLARMRSLILAADPGMTEEWKWNNPVWAHHGIVCTGEAYTRVVKLTFARGAGLPDPSSLFNSSLAGNTRRAIDIHEGETVSARAFKALVKAAVARNRPAAKKPAKKR